MDENLKDKLNAWKVELEPPRTFRSEVWQRIAARESARRNSVWHKLREWIAAELPKPQYATAVVLIGATLSIGLAHVQAQGINTKHWRQLEARYVTSINPAAQAAALQ